MAIWRPVKGLNLIVSSWLLVPQGSWARVNPSCTRKALTRCRARLPVAMLWRWIFSPDFGLLNLFLSYFNIEGPNWLGNRTWVLPSFVIMSLWGVGCGMVIYLAGLQGIPTDLYEAVEIDGATAFRRIWHITLPMLSPVILFQLIMGVISSIQIFTQAFIMTDGGPANASLFYMLYLYRQAFEYRNMEYASVLAWILFLCILALTLLLFRMTSAWVYYEAETQRT